MHIVLATPQYPPEVGGPATYTKEIVERLHSAHELVVVAYADDTESLSGAKLIVISKRQPLPTRLIKYFFALLRAARTADVIYVQNAMASGLPAALVGMLLRKPVILKFVGDEAWERASQAHKTTKQLEDFLKKPEGSMRSRLMMMVEGFVLRRMSIVTTPSAYLSELLITYYKVKRSRAVVNYNAVGNVEQPHLQTLRIAHQIMTGVRLVPWKNVGGIIRAIALLKKEFPDVRLVVAGDGPERTTLEELARSLAVEQHVEFLGRVSREKVLEVQMQSAVQVLNSWYEGMPHGALESFATHTPIVATNTPGTNEAVFNEKTGLLVPVGDDQALAGAIERIFTDPALCTQMVEGGTKLLHEKFSWETHIKTLLEMFRTAKEV